MAKSNSYFGLRRGSTKSLTFSVVDGKQITKDRVEGGKNPRTPAQMSQRCLLYTVCTAYSAMKSICNHSFEDVTAGLQSMYAFRKENMKQIKLCKDAGNGFFGFNKYKDSGLVPGSYIISKGSLPDSCPNAAFTSVTVASATPSFGSSGLTVSVVMKPQLAANATAGNTYLAAIASRQVNGNWHRSNAQFDVQNATPTFAQAIATYPVGDERILNGSADFTSTTSQTPSSGGGTSPSPSQGGETGGGTTGGSSGGSTGGDDGGDGGADAN